MSVINKTNKNYKRSQKGRSMVEMLGVLAIVGVLSVGGVYGYGVAMKKHKANELLHQASMLATTISAQAMTNNGTLPQTIASFGNSSYGTFSPSVTDALDGKGFTITIENVDSAVCDQLKKGGMVQNVDCNPDAKTATLTYYKNLATTEAEGKNSPTGETSTGFGDIQGKDCTDSDVVDSEICLNGKMYYCYPAGGISEWNANPWGRETIECSSCDDSYSDRMRYEGTDYCCVDGDWSVCTLEPEPEPESSEFKNIAGKDCTDSGVVGGKIYLDGVVYYCNSSTGKWERTDLSAQHCGYYTEEVHYAGVDYCCDFNYHEWYPCMKGSCSGSGYASYYQGYSDGLIVQCVNGNWQRPTCVSNVDIDGDGVFEPGTYWCNGKSNEGVHSDLSDVCDYVCSWGS